MRTLRLSDLPFPCLWAPGNVTRLKNDDDEEEDGYESGSSDGDTETRDEDGEYGDIIISHSDGRHRGGVKIFRKNALSLATQCTICSVRISFAKSGFWPKAALRHGYPPTNVAAWRGDTNAPLRVVRKLFPASAGACFSAPVACGARSGTTSPASHRKSDASTTPSACQPPGATDPPPRSVEKMFWASPRACFGGLGRAIALNIFFSDLLSSRPRGYRRHWPR